MSKIFKTIARPFLSSMEPLSLHGLAASGLSAALALSAIVLPAWSLPSSSGSAVMEAVDCKITESASVAKLDDKTADGKPYQITSAIVNASPEEVFALLTDYKKSGLLFKNLTKSEVVSRDEDSKTSQVAFSLRGIMNIWSFDYVLSIKENFPSSIEFHRLSGAFKRNEGYWKLTSLDGGRRTEVVYGKYIDSGLMVPPQIVEKQVRESTASVVQNLKKVAENPSIKLAAHH
jgi:ribosome-associated toxin RatA of RatAB toxin-antitoxin module